jgi:hypothetical protein
MTFIGTEAYGGRQYDGGAVRCLPRRDRSGSLYRSDRLMGLTLLLLSLPGRYYEDDDLNLRIIRAVNAGLCSERVHFSSSEFKHGAESEWNAGYRRYAVDVR